MKFLIFGLILLLSSCTQQQHTPRRKYLTLNGWSHHINRSYNWNENQNITGIEIELSENYNLELSKFLTSFGDDGRAININRIYHIKGTNTEFLFMKYGIADGYGTGIFPFFMPGVGKNFDHLRTELVILPSVLILFAKVPF